MYFSEQWRGNYFPVRNFSSAVFLVAYTKIRTHAFCCVNNKILRFIGHTFNGVSEMKISYKISRPFHLENVFCILSRRRRVLYIIFIVLVKVEFRSFGAITIDNSWNLKRSNEITYTCLYIKKIKIKATFIQQDGKTIKLTP